MSNGGDTSCGSGESASRLEDLVGMLESGQPGTRDNTTNVVGAASGESIARDDSWARLAEQFAEIHGDVVGHGAPITTPFGQKALLYADWAASGRALSSVESFVQNTVEPSHL